VPVLSSGFLLVKRGLVGRGKASTREEVGFFSAVGESAANSYGALKHLGHGEVFGEGSRVETGRGVNNLHRADAEVVR